MNLAEAVIHAHRLNAQTNEEQYALVEPYFADIEAYALTILEAARQQEEDTTIGGFQTLFLYAYLRGKADANGWQQ